MVVDADNCSSNPCMNGGTCVDSIAHFTCTCDEGFTGATCDMGKVIFAFTYYLFCVERLMQIP